MEIQKYLPGPMLAILGTAFGMYWQTDKETMLVSKKPQIAFSLYWA